ncbi:unnamed protein product, partial [Symbiodinium pilosum]
MSGLSGPHVRAVRATCPGVRATCPGRPSHDRASGPSCPGRRPRVRAVRARATCARPTCPGFRAVRVRAVRATCPLSGLSEPPVRDVSGPGVHLSGPHVRAKPHVVQACDIAFLPASLGGLGLMHAERLSPAAYWAAWADASPMLQQRCPRRRGLPSRSRAPSLQAAAAAGVHLEGQGWGQRPGWEACLRTAAPQAARSEPGQLVGKGVLLSQEQVSESGQCLRCPQPKATYRQQRSSSSQLTRHPAGCRCDEALKDRCWPLAFRCCHAWDLDCRRAIGKQ